MKTLTLAWLAVLVTTTAHARIGESPAQCEARYGPPHRLNKNNGASYSKAGIQIDVTFEGGKAVVVAYRRRDKQDLTGGQIQALLKANGPGFWFDKQVEPGVAIVENTTADLLAFQNVLELHKIVIIRTATAVTAAKRQAAAEAASVSGL